MPTVWMLALTSSTKAKDTSVSRVMYDPEDPRVLELAPQDLPLVRAAEYASRELQLLRAKCFDCRHRGASATEGLEEQTERILDPFVWIEDNAVVIIVDEADR